jgi:hypothetical protein
MDGYFCRKREMNFWYGSFFSQRKLQILVGFIALLNAIVFS